MFWMSADTITGQLWQQDRDEIFFRLSRYDSDDEIQNYVSSVKNHYTQLRVQHPGVDTGVLFQNLDEVSHKIGLYKVKLKQAVSVPKIEGSHRISAPASNPNELVSSPACSRPNLQPSSLATPRVGMWQSTAVALPPLGNNQELSDAPPPYTTIVTPPAKDRLAALPPIPAWGSNVIFAPGTFDGYTSEEIIEHYRPQIHRLVLEGLKFQV